MRGQGGPTTAALIAAMHCYILAEETALLWLAWSLLERLLLRLLGEGSVAFRRRLNLLHEQPLHLFQHMQLR